jgi:hypothetical protein
MDRCKLEYMIKRFDFNEKKKMIRLIDPYGDYEFNKYICRFLLDPDTLDEDILCNIGPAHTLYFINYQIDGESELTKLFQEDKEKELEEIKEKYINQYRLINELCIKNNTYPFFKDPTNIKECEKTRLDIVKIIPEEIIDDFFGVCSIRDYEPPIYSGLE